MLTICNKLSLKLLLLPTVYFSGEKMTMKPNFWSLQFKLNSICIICHMMSFPHSLVCPICT